MRAFNAHNMRLWLIASIDKKGELTFNSQVFSSQLLNSPITNWSHHQPCGINVGQRRVAQQERFWY